MAPLKKQKTKKKGKKKKERKRRQVLFIQLFPHCLHNFIVIDVLWNEISDACKIAFKFESEVVYLYDVYF